MHHKWAKDGLVAITVNLDDLEAQTAEERLATVKKVLTNKKASMANIILDEPVEFWQEKFGLAGYPFLFVFNRQGKWTRFGDEGEINYKAVDNLVVELLKEKP